MIRLIARIARAAALSAAALGIFPATASAQGWLPNEDDSLLLELRSGQFTLGDPLRGYQTPQGICVDFADAIQALDVPVRLDKKSRRATGWFFSEDRRLVIDRDANAVQAAGESEALRPGDIYDTPEGWCINLGAFSKWTGVRFRGDLSNLAVVIEGDRKLPFLEALERKRRAARLQSGTQLGQRTFDLASLPHAVAPFRAEAVGRVRGVNVSGHFLWVNGEFDSDLVPIEQRREFSLRLSGRLELGSWRLPVETGLRQSLTRRGVQVTELLTRSSVQAGRASLTVELLNRSLTGPAQLLAGEERGNRLSLIGNTAIGKVRIRGQVSFGLDGTHRGFQRNQVVIDLPVARQGMIRAGFDHDNLASRREYSLGYVQQFRRFALRGEGRLDSRGNLGAALTLAFSLGPDPVDGGWRLSRERLAETGQASVEVYRDENGDGIRQADEPAVPGVSIEAGFRSSDMATNERGRTVIDGLMPYVPVLVSIDGGTLPDPLLQPKGRGMVVVPRPGVSAKVSLPLAPTGEIEAVLLGPDGEPRGGIGIELVDENGAVVLRGRSDFDGYVLFDSVPYGTYRLRLTDNEAAKLGAAPELCGLLQINSGQTSLRLGPLRARHVPAPPNLARAN